MGLRAVVFDYGMVLSAPADEAAHADMQRIFGASAEAFEAQYWAHRHDYDSGHIDGTGYWQACAAGAGIAVTDDAVAGLIDADIRMWMSIDQAMVDWAVEVGRAGFRTAILSNIPAELVPSLLEMHWVKGFTAKVWSSHLRLAKPDPAIYHHVLEKLDVRPDEALFLDDRQENVLSARAVGMHGIIFRGIPRLHADLEQMGFANLLPPLPLSQFAAV